MFPENAGKSRRAGFRAAGFYTLILGALGSIGAVLSGLIISRWQLWGRGNLAHHHTFLWPAFGLLTGLAVWRLVVGNHASNRAFRRQASIFPSRLLCPASGSTRKYCFLNYISAS